MRYIPIKKILQIFKYSKKNLSLLKLNTKCTKYYNIIKLMYKSNVYDLLDKKYILYCICQEFSKENSDCINAIRKIMIREVLNKKVQLALENDKMNENGDDLVTDFTYYKFIRNKNFYLTIYSDLKLSENAEKLFYQNIKKEDTYLYLQIKHDNEFIDRLLDNWKGYVYSLTFLENIEKDVFQKILSRDSINLISELRIKFDIENDSECKDLLFKTFLPKCFNLQNLIIKYLPKKSDNYGNFLINATKLEKLSIVQCEDYTSIDTLNYILLDNNNLTELNIECDLSSNDENSEKIEEFNMDFSFIKKLKNLKYFELKIHQGNKLNPKELFSSLNNLPKLEFIKIESSGDITIKGINDINNVNLNGFEIISVKEFDLEKFINLHPNLSYTKFDITTEKEYIDTNFSKNMKNFYSIIDNESILFQLFKQIPVKQISLIELHIKINKLLGKMSYNCFHELANAFKFLPQLKSLGILVSPEHNEKRNVEWIENIKYLKSLNNFELMYYTLTYKELKILIKSIRNLEFLEELYLYDNRFEQLKVLKLFFYYRIPPILKKSNLMSICYKTKNRDNKNSEDEDGEESDEEKEEKNEKDKIDDDDEKETFSDNDYGEDKRRQVELEEMVENFGYPDLEFNNTQFDFNFLFN